MKFFTRQVETRHHGMETEPHVPRIVGAVAVAVLLLAGSIMCSKVVPAGHVAVGATFGKVAESALGAGFHVVGPFSRWTLFDCRQKNYDQPKVPVGSKDQLVNKIDFSIGFRANAAMAPEMLKETGGLDAVVETFLIPTFRSIVREKAKGVGRAEDWSREDVHEQVQSEVLEDLRAEMAPKGLIVQTVLIRNVEPPKVITAAIQLKKERDQAAERQEAELARFEIEQQQLVKTAEAEKAAAALEAEKILLLARAQAEANRELSRSLTKDLVELKAIEKWSGEPAACGAAVPFVDVTSGG
jgi:regulator of protease activity HflC (stomatin/prohibitin superfamily)